MAKGLELPVLEENKRTADKKGSASFIATFMVAWRIGEKTFLHKDITTLCQVVHHTEMKLRN